MSLQEWFQQSLFLHKHFPRSVANGSSQVETPRRLRVVESGWVVSGTLDSWTLTLHFLVFLGALVFNVCRFMKSSTHSSLVRLSFLNICTLLESQYFFHNQLDFRLSVESPTQQLHPMNVDASSVSSSSERDVGYPHGPCLTPAMKFCSLDRVSPYSFAALA